MGNKGLLQTGVRLSGSTFEPGGASSWRSDVELESGECGVECIVAGRWEGIGTWPMLPTRWSRVVKRGLSASAPCSVFPTVRDAGAERGQTSLTIEGGGGGQTEFAVLILRPGDQNPSPGGPSVPSLEAAEPSSLQQVSINETGYKARNLQELSPMMLAHVRVEPRLLV